MQRPMILKCMVSWSEETPSMYHVSTNQFDGTEVVFKTSQYNVQLNEPITAEKPAVVGWVSVTQEAKQGKLVAITLPSPSINFGKNISVDETQLLPLGVSIANFGGHK